MSLTCYELRRKLERYEASVPAEVAMREIFDIPEDEDDVDFEFAEDLDDEPQDNQGDAEQIVVVEKEESDDYQPTTDKPEAAADKKAGKK